MLPVTTMSRPGFSFSARVSSTASPDRIVEFCHAGPGHSRGNDVLLHLVEVIGDARGVVGLLGPVAAQILESSPTHEKSVGLAVLTV
jgi:hypothetical protein